MMAHNNGDYNQYDNKRNDERSNTYVQQKAHSQSVIPAAAAASESIALPHRKSVQMVLHECGVDSKIGLSDHEANNRIDLNGLHSVGASNLPPDWLFCLLDFLQVATQLTGMILYSIGIVCFVCYAVIAPNSMFVCI
jgi:hypothetical protein